LLFFESKYFLILEKNSVSISFRAVWASASIFTKVNFQLYNIVKSIYLIDQLVWLCTPRWFQVCRFFFFSGFQCALLKTAVKFVRRNAHY
jgi:hypothetical protein